MPAILVDAPLPRELECVASRTLPFPESPIMPTLNRFPLLGLWAREAARRLGYRKDEAEALGHAYAVLYAIRARGPTHKKAKKPQAKPSAPATAPPPAPTVEQLDFGGDRL